MVKGFDHLACMTGVDEVTYMLFLVRPVECAGEAMIGTSDASMPTYGSIVKLCDKQLLKGRFGWNEESVQIKNEILSEDVVWVCFRIMLNGFP